MGEAKRREDLGPTRKIQFANYELMDVVRYLVPQQGQPGQPPPKKISHDQRRQLRSALRQLGILDIWHDVKNGINIEPKDLPKTQVKELTVDAINTLLTTIAGEMEYLDVLNIGEIEDRLEDAKAGIYQLPVPEAAKDEPVEATAPPVLESVPPPTE